MKDGLFGLSTPSDLFRKLEDEYEGLKSSPNDVYRAFNFFVTATHLADWINKGDRNATNNYRKNHRILMICDHLACSGKHFHLNDKRHTSVAGAEKQGWVKGGWVEPGWVGDELMVSFSEKAEQELGVRSESVSSLARRVVEFWRNEINKEAT